MQPVPIPSPPANENVYPCRLVLYVTDPEVVDELEHRAEGADRESGAESRAESLDERILEALRAGERSKSGLATKLGLSSVTGQLNRAVTALLERGLIELTIPDKPNRRLQRYRLTAAGRAGVAKARGR